MASTEAGRGRLRVVSRLDDDESDLSAELVDRPALWRRLSPIVTHPLVEVVAVEIAAVGALVGAIAVVFWPLLTGIGVYAESDTFTFFYPVFAVLYAAIQAGELPYWSPHVFGGFPLFAEGQIGALYPPSYLAAQLPTAVEGFLALRVFHVGVAVFGAFALARAHGIGSTGAVIGGLSFGLGSFVVAQQHHANLLAATVWLPLLLACVELALARQGWVGHGLLGLAALILGVAALATHVQPLMLSGAMLVAYVLVRQAWMAVSEVRARGLRRGVLHGGLLLADAFAMVVFVAAVGALIAAAQILPLYELSQESWRAFGWSYQDAIEYSFPPVNFVTLLFPFFFRQADGGQWSLWLAWELVLYIGVAPLLLAVVAVVSMRRWAITFFFVAALVSAGASLGGYAPYGLYEWLWHIPGMSLQRAPARFTLITTLSLAMLAAFGTDRLASLAADTMRSHRRGLLVVALATLSLLAVTAGQLVAWRAWIQADRPAAMQWLAAGYLAQAQDPLQQLGPMEVVFGLDNALNLANPKTAVPLALLGVFAVLVLLWREFPSWRRAWQMALVALVAIDLAVFASDFHPLVDVSYLGNPGPAGRMLVDRAGPWRVLTRPEVEYPQPNELLPHGVAEAAGYSPLQLDRHRWYAQSVQTVDNVLLDLWSVRWIVETSRPEALPSYHLVSYHPRRPLMIGGVGTPNGQIALHPEATPATQVRLIASLSGGETIPDGEQVGELLLSDQDGVRHIVSIRAGREIADWRPRAAGVVVAHRPIQAATSIYLTDQGPERILGYAEIPLPRRITVTGVQYRHTNQAGRTILHAVGLYDREEDIVAQVSRQDRYAVAYADADVTIYENPGAYPRAFVVPEAVLAPDGPSAMARLREGPLDPRQQVVIENTPAGSLGPFAGTQPVDAPIVAEGGSVLDIQADAPGGGFLVLTDPFYPGWRAFVDGVETPILKANFLFRAVELPPGSHIVRFTFVPRGLERGATLSLAGVAVAVGAAVIGMGGPMVVGWLRRRRPASDFRDDEQDEDEDA